MGCYCCCVTHPPSRSAVSLWWFMFTTRSLCPGLNKKKQQGIFQIGVLMNINQRFMEQTRVQGQDTGDRRGQGSKPHRVKPIALHPHRDMSSPVTLARCCTVEVFPVPVSPTRRTGSPLATHTASCSSSTADGRVAANVWLYLFKTC